MCIHYTGRSVNSGTMSGSVHIYADPDTYDLVAGDLVMSDEQLYQQQPQQQQLDPAHITIDTVVHRGMAISRNIPCVVCDSEITCYYFPYLFDRSIFWSYPRLCRCDR